MLAILVAALITQVLPAAGPALPLEALKDAKLQGVSLGETWANGCKSVGFSYGSDLTVDEIAELCRQEWYFQDEQSWTDQDSFWFSRFANGVYQSVNVSKTAATYRKSDSNGTSSITRIDASTTIRITESPQQDQRILRWYWGAISPDPPTPMIKVPFLKGVMTTEVSVDSFDNLMSSKGLTYIGSDAYVYSAVVDQSYEKLEKQLQTWASKNGYTKTSWASWFKPNTRLFEIEVRGHLSLGREKSRLVIYASDRKAEHPIARVKY